MNSDKADYVEWEIVKGDQSYEVQIDLDKSNKASKIDVTTNMWKADPTKKALKGTKVPPWAGAMLVIATATAR